MCLGLPSSNCSRVAGRVATSCEIELHSSKYVCYRMSRVIVTAMATSLASMCTASIPCHKGVGTQDTVAISGHTEQRLPDPRAASYT
jgi:hypothetical protein